MIAPVFERDVPKHRIAVKPEAGEQRDLALVERVELGPHLVQVEVTEAVADQRSRGVLCKLAGAVVVGLPVAEVERDIRRAEHPVNVDKTNNTKQQTDNKTHDHEQENKRAGAD